jgi:hypothetical protein
MKRLIIIFALLAPLRMTFAQGPPDTTFDFSYVDTTNIISFDSLTWITFGDLDSSKMNFKLLYDVVPTSTNLPYLQGELTDTPCSLGDFLNACMEYNIANLWGKPEIDLVEMYSTSETTFLEDNIIPIGIFYYSFDKIKPNAFGDNLIQVGINGISLEDVSGVNPYETMTAVVMTPILDLVGNTSFSFMIDSRFFYTNQNLNIDEITIDFDDGLGPQNLSVDVPYAVNYDSYGTKSIEIRVKLTDKTELNSHSKITLSENIPDGVPPIIDRRLTDFPPNEIRLLCANVEFPGIPLGTSCGEYGIWYGCGNDYLRKPLIISSGFDPFNLKRLLFSVRGAPLYDTYNGVDMNSNNNGNNLLERLRQEGYDIILLDFYDGWDYIQSNAALFRKLILDINTEVALNGSKHEAVVMGFSSGALNGRLALSMLENQHQINAANPTHHAWKYVSFDGEHQGANIPLGLQYYIEYLFFNGFPSALNPLANLPALIGYPSYMNPTAYQTLLYHRSNSNNTNAYQNTLRDGLFNYINGQRPASGGYPTGTRNIAVSQGSSNGLNLTGCCFSAGNNLLTAKTLHIINLFTGTFVREKIEYNAVGTSNHVFKVAHDVKYSWFNNWITLSSFTAYANNAVSLDNAPASVTNFHHSTVKPPFLFNVPPFVNINYVPSDEAFAPTLSGLDVRNGSVNNLGMMTQSLTLNVQNLLFYNGTSVSGPFTPNINFGYPHLGLTNPKLYTPFDALYAHYNANSFHIVNPLLGMANFVFTEVAPAHLKLQNRTIGSSEVYVAAFEARYSIESGNMVTWTTPFNDYIIDQHGNVDFSAGQYIQLQPGFHAVVGSQFYAFIQPYACEPKNLSSSGTSPSSNTTTRHKEDALSAAEKPIIIRNNFYPNPSKAIFNMLLNEKQSIMSITLIDIMGKKYQVSSWSMANTLITLDLSSWENGMYIVILELENGVTISNKIIKQ